MIYVLVLSLSLNIILLYLCKHMMKETLFWREHQNTGPVYAHWIDDKTWRCGGCGVANDYTSRHCHFCQRQRLELDDIK